MNKKFYSFGIAALMLLMSGNAMATDYYLSANGDDANDGKTAATALKTLKALMPKIQQNTNEVQHVYVSGIIKVDEEWTKAHIRDFVVEGNDPNEDGFDAEGKCAIFNLNNSLATFKNLSFKNGYKDSGNKGAGAIWGGPLRLTLENCVFEGNKGTQTNANECGGAVFVQQATPQGKTNMGGLYATNCKFINNSSLAGGGAIVARLGYAVELKNCLFENNTSSYTGAGGGAIYFNSIASSVKVDGCAFVGNSTELNNGGAITVYLASVNGSTYTISNSTFYNNTAKSGGAFFASDDKGNSTNNVFNFVHCTMSGNITLGSIGGAGGINIESKPCTVNVVNSVLQGNLSKGNPNLYADVTFGTTPTKFVNSHVGYVRQLADNEACYTITGGKVDYLGKISQAADLDVTDFDADAHIFRLKATSDATSAADLIADAAYGVTTDQLGQAWTKPYIGAVQLLEGETTGISGIKTDAPKSIKGIYNIAGQYVGNDASGLAKGLYIINGKKVVIK